MRLNFKNFLLVSFLLLSLAGFADATFLTLKHYRQEPVGCRIGGGCETVTTSQYAALGPFPIALLGALYYLTIFFGLLAYLTTQNHRLLNKISYLTLVGFVFSVYLVFLQAFVIKAYCFYCLISAVISSLLLAVGTLWLKNHSGDKLASDG